MELYIAPFNAQRINCYTSLISLDLNYLNTNTNKLKTFSKIIKIGLVILLLATCKKDEESVLTNQIGTVKDADGNVYNTVTIGTQVWMASNLKTTKYKDGTAIPLVSDDKAWQTRSGPAYCWYNNEEATYKNTYGALYNFYTVYTGKLCPAGWHVPTYKEWDKLITYLGGENIAGGKQKEAGTGHWQSPNTGATNATGFTGLPGGVRNQFADFGNIGQYSHFWAAEPPSSEYNWSWYLYYKDARFYKEIFDWRDGFSVRCMKD